MMMPQPSEALRQRTATAVCLACGENPKHPGDARGNEYRWQDYLEVGDAVLHEVQRDQASAERTVFEQCLQLVARAPTTSHAWDQIRDAMLARAAELKAAAPEEKHGDVAAQGLGDPIREQAGAADLEEPMVDGWPLYSCLPPPANSADAAQPHPDDLAIDRFAAVMKAKMAAGRAKGRTGWDDPAQCDVEDLAAALIIHNQKGDPVDIGTFAMMIHQRGASDAVLAQAFNEFIAALVPDSTAPSGYRPAAQEPTGDQLRAIIKNLGSLGTDHADAPMTYVLAGWRAAVARAKAREAVREPGAVPEWFLQICKDEFTRRSLTSLPRKARFGDDRGMTVDQVHAWMLETGKAFEEAVGILIEAQGDASDSPVNEAPTDTVETMLDERERPAFEAWLKVPMRQKPFDLTRSPAGWYRKVETRQLWWAWLRRATLANEVLSRNASSNVEPEAWFAGDGHGCWIEHAAPKLGVADGEGLVPKWAEPLAGPRTLDAVRTALAAHTLLRDLGTQARGWEVRNEDAHAFPSPAAKYPDLHAYHSAVGGVGEHAFNWKDKPHRLVYDLTRMVAALRDDVRAALQVTPVVEGCAVSSTTIRAISNEEAKSSTRQYSAADFVSGPLPIPLSGPRVVVDFAEFGVRHAEALYEKNRK